jgi:DNA-binding SARP family transcriptional activator
MAINVGAPTLHARLLGGFAVLGPGEDRDETPWERFDTTSQVLKFLLLQPRLRCHPSAVVNVLWPDVDADKALERLQFHVKRLRTLLQDKTVGVKGLRLVVLDKTVVALDAAVFTYVDALEFSAAASRALANNNVELCHAALALYGGELLPQDLSWNWTHGPRRSLAERRQAVLGHAARLLHAAGDTHGAIPLLAALLAADPCNERAARLLMECYDAEGERAEASRVYHTLRAHLQEELHVLPGAKTEELYAAIRHAPAAPRSVPASLVPAQRRRRPRPTELGHLLGREEELSYVDLLLGMVQQRGGGYALFVQGEAGIGKTHLAHEILNRARRRGYSILAGFVRRGGAAPYAPVVDALRVHAATAPEETLRRALASAPGAAALVPEVAARLGLAPAATAGDDLLRRDLVHAVATLSADRPTAFFLDDLQDADAATLTWLGDLLLAGSPAGLLVLATLRTEPAVPPGLDAVIEECRRRGTGETLALHGMPLAAVQAYLATLLGREPTPELAAEMHQKTRGNPFLMAEIARELRAQGALEPRGALWSLPRGRLPVPESVRGLARARLGVLDDEARRLVALAAVAGTTSVPLLARLGGWDAATTLDLLDRLVAAGILEEREGYRFRHEMLREAVYDLQGAERRALLHATVAAALEQDFLAGGPGAPDVAELAHHYLLGGVAVARQAAHYAALAGDRAAALFAYREAATRYRDALERVPEAERVDLYERLGTALAAAGEHGAAIEAFEAALQFYAGAPADDELARARLLLGLGSALAHSGRHSEAGERLAEAEAALAAAGGRSGSGPSDGARNLLHGRVRGARARLALEIGDLAGARDLATEALRLLEPLPEAMLDRLEVRNDLAGALFHRGELDEAQRYLEAQLPDAQALGHPAMLCRLHANRGLILLLQGNLPAALAANEQAAEVLGGYHDTYRRTHLLADRGEMQAVSGAWDDAIATLGLAIEAAEREGWPHLATRAHADVAVPLLARGRFDEAREHLQRCIAAATRPGFGDEVPLIMALVRRATLHRLQGRLVAAADDLKHAQAAAERLGRPQELADVHLGLSRLCAVQGDRPGAEEHAAGALALATAHGFGLYQARARVALAYATRDRDSAHALAALDEAIAALRAGEARPDLSEALALQATLLPPGPAARRAHGEAEMLRRRLGIVVNHFL